MKRLLFLALLLSVTFTFGCPPPKNDNGNANRTIAGNMNANMNANGDGSGLVDANDKGMSFIVRYKGGNPANGVEIVVALESVPLKKNVNKLTFYAQNALTVDIKEVLIEFKTTDPFDGTPPFKIGTITTLSVGNSQKRKAVGNAGTYPYKITAYGMDGKVLASLDPQVEIVN